MSNRRTISSIVDKEAKVFSLYTLEERALPNMMDGFKPVQRFFVYSALQNAKTTFQKVVSVSGRVADYGYEHGETSAADAGNLMANTWSNNMPIIQGRGNFGSRMIQDAAAARYTFCKIHDDFHKVFKDIELSPKHESESHKPPAFYLPVIPYVLLNGVRGIATGYSTLILPHCPKSVTECVTEYVKTGKIKNEPTVKFPEFSGEIINAEENKFILEGKYEIVGKTKLIITEIPYKYDRISFVEHLDDLEEKNTIVRYDDKCGGKNIFRFEVTLKRDFIGDKDTPESTHEKIMKVFKMRQSITQNINCIRHTGLLKEYKSASELIKDFVDYRLPFIQTRIDNKIKDTTHAISLAEAKIEFIQKIISGDLDPRHKKRAEFISEIEKYETMKDFSDILIAMNFYHATEDELKKLFKALYDLNEELKYWEKTTPKKEYLLDLKRI